MNTELLIRTIDAIESGEVHWDQTNWCHCFAGNAMRLNGNMPFMRHYTNEDDGNHWLVRVRDDNGEEVGVEQEAARVLGLTTEQADVLFAYDNTLDDLKTVVSSFVQESLAEEASFAEEEVSA